MRAVLPFAAVLLLGACHVSTNDGDDGGSHQTINRNFQVGAFQKIVLAGPYDVVVTVGGAPSVRAEGDKTGMDRLEINSGGDQLTIGAHHGDNVSWNLFGSHHNHVTVCVTVPSLAGVTITGSGDMKIDKVAGNAFDATVSGSGDLQVASMQVGQAHVSLAGSGDMSASGKVQQATISIAGSGDFSASGLEIGNATISVVGSGDVTARATQTADVTVMGSGDVKLSGGAKCTAHKMGSGDINCSA